MPFTEDTFEQAVLAIFQNLGYTFLHGPDIDRDYSSPILEPVLRDSLVKLNKGMPVEAINEAITKLKNFESGSQLQKNMAEGERGQTDAQDDRTGKRQYPCPVP